MSESKKRRRSVIMPYLVAMIALIITMITGAVIFIIYAGSLKNKNAELEKALATSASNDAVTVTSDTNGYTQAEVDSMVESAKTEAALAKEAEIKDYIKSHMSMKDPSTPELLRKLFPEYIVYRGSVGYSFAPKDSSLPPVQVDVYAFETDENGALYYAPNGEKDCYTGIDVSQYQGSIDWKKVKDYGIDYAFVRVGIRGYGSGKLVLDSEFENNAKGVSANEIDMGVYFFTQATSIEEAEEEADFVIEAISPYKVTYPVVIDVEKITDGNARGDAISAEERTAYTIAFCEKVKAAGYTPMIYGNMFTLFTMLDMTKLTDYDIWFAFYDDYLYYPYKIHTWQYTESLSIPGISTKVDGNITFK